MTGQPPSSPFNRIRPQNPSLQAILIASVVLFILFLWLNFALSQEIESIGREIQVKTEELRALERRQGALLTEISVASSQEKKAAEARTLGYRPQTPVYILYAQPLAATTGEGLGSQWPEAVLADGGGPHQEMSRSLWEMVARQSGSTPPETAP